MMKEGNVNKVWSELRAFKRRYYANQLLRGSLLLGGSLMALYFILNALEFTFRFGPAVRTVLFIFFVLVAAASIIYFILKPLLILTGRQKGMSDDEAARRIGRSFPVVSDRLL
ncbi:MAG: hypothetical protein OEX02_21685, partial [Cyclobacteriaceae bacterium]|nr:hypothetical protein [Cyclobacteriaceae bacterium]